jgi:hypothetical protein
MRAKLFPVLSLLVLMAGCERKAANSDVAADTSAVTGADSVGGAAPTRNKPQILSVTIRVRTAAGKESNMEVDLKGDPSDAIFLSKEAFEKFAVPYYINRKGEGPETVAVLRRKVQDEVNKYGFIIILHKLRSKVEMPGEQWLRGSFRF